MIRIKDIAEKAGVSPTTVSNVIHGKSGRVSEETVERINRILEEMNYVPSISARMLAREHSGLIGVVLGYTRAGMKYALEDPFIAELVGSLEYRIQEKGYYMMLVTRHKGRDLMEQILGWNLEAMISIGLGEREIRKVRSRFSGPMAVIDGYCPLPEGVTNVRTDDRGGGYLMGKYLLKQGHRDLLFLTDNDESVDHERWLGVKDALEEEQVGDAASRHILVSQDPSKRRRQYREMLPFFRQQSVLFFASDLYAVEALNFLQDQGIRVPQDVSVAGFDDVAYAKLSRPALTTVRQNVGEKARRSVDALIGKMNGETVGTEYRISTLLVERDSVSATLQTD
ncbi:MAG TPA: LacI family transcriptional regulator [Candidatus Fusicatenibacter merdavium]|uniref:LacI family transcriptional regulator n=1 Tax=Candidatus Fusicatenibacter merdavium TaxID=2838600 RepID=A0A9D1XCB1_9FIRM|nr:LacI family transcriptional regulator [Candidatus Fusicatenibacter merdavium]